MSPQRELSPKQIAALERVGQVGAELAAQSLSRIIGRPLSLVTTSVLLLPFQRVLDVLGGPEREVVGVYLAIQGEAQGQVLFVIARERALALIHKMYDPGEVKGEESPHFSVGLTLVGDVLGISFLNALSGATKLPLFGSPTQTVSDMAGAICSPLLADATRHSEHVLLYQCRFQWGDLAADTHWFLVPEPDSMEKILEALGV